MDLLTSEGTPWPFASLEGALTQTLSISPWMMEKREPSAEGESAINELLFM